LHLLNAEETKITHLGCYYSIFALKTKQKSKNS